jgi:hypothetical protein
MATVFIKSRENVARLARVCERDFQSGSTAQKRRLRDSDTTRFPLQDTEASLTYLSQPT